MKSPVPIASALGVALLWLAVPDVQAQINDIDPAALQQMAQILQAKEARSALERKLGSALASAVQNSPQVRGAAPGITGGVDDIPGRGILVDVRGALPPATISQGGGEVISASPQTGHVRARLP